MWREVANNVGEINPREMKMSVMARIVKVGTPILLSCLAAIYISIT